MQEKASYERISKVFVYSMQVLEIDDFCWNKYKVKKTWSANAVWGTVADALYLCAIK